VAKSKATTLREGRTSKENYGLALMMKLMVMMKITITWRRSNTGRYFPTNRVAGAPYDLSPCELFRRKSAAPGRAKLSLFREQVLILAHCANDCRASIDHDDSEMFEQATEYNGRETRQFISNFNNVSP
jgi:hypothetical protein